MYSTANGAPTAGSAAAGPRPRRARRPGAAPPPLRLHLLVELRLASVVEQVRDEQFVGDEEQDDDAAGDQELTESPGEGPQPAGAADLVVLPHVRPERRREATSSPAPRAIAAVPPRSGPATENPV